MILSTGRSRRAVRGLGARRLLRALIAALAGACVAPAATRLAAQVVTAPPSAAAPKDTLPTERPLRAFLDCPTFFAGRWVPACRGDYFRRAIPWVDWTRDRIDAEVQVLVTSIGTGGGGSEFTVAFLGRGRFDGRADTLRLTTGQGASEDEARRALGQTIEAGLFPYAQRSSMAPYLRVAYDDALAPKSAAANGTARDPWNAWVFTTDVGGRASGESATHSTYASLSLDANRTTEASKYSLGVFANSSHSSYRIDDTTTATSQVRTVLGYVRATYSLDGHWSLGGNMRYDYDEYRNTAFALRAAPVLEYNVFPWSEATQRQLTISYATSLEYFRYQDTTIFNRISELRPRHLLTAGLSNRQSWGSSFVTARASQFLHDLGKYQLALNGDVNVRVARGLSLRFSAAVASVRDQLYLSRAGLSETDILLRQRALATTYSYFFGGGINYAFGSVFNTVVNPRLDAFRVGPN